MPPQSGNSSVPTASDVVLRYESLRERGEDVTPEMLCEQMGCPDLVDEVRQQLHDLESIRHFLRTTTTGHEPGGAGKPATAADPAPRPKIDSYDILEDIGRGGFGVVWRGYDADLNRHVAIKVPRPDRRFSDEEINLFINEARKAAALDHPHIVRVYHAHRRGKTFFIISEYIDGKNLRERMLERHFTAREAARIVAEAAEALHHAHLRGLVHRDVKPGNILLNRELKAYLADFGLATTEEEQLEERAGVMGTVAYMSPEQAQQGNRRVDARTDIYSLGVVLYEMLTGRLPFVARDTVDYLDQIVNRDARPPRTIDDAIPAELERICLKCLAKPVAERYTTAADLAHDLRAWLRQHAAGAADTDVEPAAVVMGSGLRGRSWPRRRTLLAVTAPLAIAVITLAVLRPWENASEGPTGDPKYNGSEELAEPEPGVWQNLLDRKPALVLRPKSDKFHWEFKDGKSLFWFTPGPCMFRLGSARGDSFDIEVTLEQPHLAGHRGLFFGYQSALAAAEAQTVPALLVVPNAFDFPPSTIFRAAIDLDPAKKGSQKVKALGPQLSPDDVSARNFTLKVSVRDGKFQEILVNGSPRGELIAFDQQPLLPLTGDFGVFADHSGGYLTAARWKIHKKEN